MRSFVTTPVRPSGDVMRIEAAGGAASDACALSGAAASCADATDIVKAVAIATAVNRIARVVQALPRMFMRGRLRRRNSHRNMPLGDRASTPEAGRGMTQATARDQSDRAADILEVARRAGAARLQSTARRGV